MESSLAGSVGDESAPAAGCIALSSKTCTLAAPKYVFWCLGSTVGTHECLGLPALPAVMLP